MTASEAHRAIEEEARAEFERAAALTQNERERAFLGERARACGGG